VLGAASAAADVPKALLQFFIAWSWQGRRFVAVVGGTLDFERGVLVLRRMQE
jgi:hypothetical protein